MLDRFRRRRSSALVDLALPSSEAYRALRLSLQLRSDTSDSNVILVTSADPREGKSTVACNFARVSSLNRATVLLIDCDLRAPSVHENLGLLRSPGLVELIAADGELDDFIQHAPGGQIDVLSAGRPIPRSGDLLSSQRVARLLRQAAEKYDLVVLDSPPVLAVADAEGLASHPGVTVLLVIKPSTHRRAIVKALRKLRLIEASVAGTVLNDWGRQKKTSYHYGR